MMFLWLLALTIAGKITALLKDIVFAGTFGAGPSADAYFVANQIPGLVWLAVYGTIVSVFAPMYIQRMADRHAASSFANEAIRYYVYVAIIFTATCWIAADLLVALTAPSFDGQTHALAVKLTRIMVLAFAITGYVGVQNAIQQANGRFLSPLAVPVVNNVLATLAVLLAWYCDNVAIAVAGAVGAYLVQAVIQRFQTLHFYASELQWKVSSDVIKRLTLLSAPVSVALLLDQMNILLGNALASGFGSGAVAQFNYANRLALFVTTLFSWLVSYLFFPAVARNAANLDDEANGALITRALAIILVATAPAAAGAFAMREELITLIYQRGAFSDQDVVITANLFGVLGVGIIFAATREFLNRVFFSYQQTVAPWAAGLVAICANIGLSFWAIERIGLSGIALGNSLAAVTFLVCQLVLLYLWKPQLLQARLLVYAFAIISAAVAGYFVATSMAVHLPSAWPVLGRLQITGLALLLGYVVALAVLLMLVGISPKSALNELKGRSMPKETR